MEEEAHKIQATMYAVNDKIEWLDLPTESICYACWRKGREKYPPSKVWVLWVDCVNRDLIGRVCDRCHTVFSRRIDSKPVI